MRIDIKRKKNRKTFRSKEIDIHKFQTRIDTDSLAVGEY